jgi:DNA-binding response OmpR family regulator
MSRDGRDGLAPLVLLVEDELGLSKLMVMILEDEGYRVIEAANGAQGLRKLEQETPALIITDYMMPELNGVEMVRAIRRNPAFDHVRILMMSAALPQQIPGRDLIDQFLPKGTGLDALIETVRRLVGDDAEPEDPGSGGLDV